MACKVLVIESRTNQDIGENRSEQWHIKSTFDLLGIRVKVIEVRTLKGFYSAIKKAESEHIDYVHFSGHGKESGIQIGDKDFITWKELDKNCWPSLRQKCLSFSSCHVAKGVEEIFSHHATFCSAIVAATRGVSWPESAIAFSAFFLRATNPETTTDQDVRVMNHICGAGTFKVFSANIGGYTRVLS